ncbi:hypothetical protein BV25DRAFT_1916893 [Artomyces pyxidatus]|uniref:Uncharacterized protein n=1 Tax=Artomyces pyxidatus TaxID=48021 RepID=A0ACB8T0E5_9AGAM|nr:hypothetical protein BV25DRAFT_1916893 [Artomyces pyxidatus]
MSTFTSASSSSVSQAPTAAPPPTTGSGITFGQSSTLYLYTFLATLGVLLVISVTIITRSVVLRRRAREAILLAIANGTYVPPRPPPSALGERPRMWQTYLEKTAPGEKGDDDLEKGWEAITPVSAVVLKPSPARMDSGEERGPFEFIRPVASSIHRYVSPSTQRRPPSPTTSSAAPGSTPPEDSPVQLAVLIAMPSNSLKSEDTRVGIPLLELGVSSARLAQTGLE